VRSVADFVDIGGIAKSYKVSMIIDDNNTFFGRNSGLYNSY
jgi:hypothetical protein